MRLSFIAIKLILRRLYFYHLTGAFVAEMASSDWTTSQGQTKRKGQVAGAFWEAVPWRLALFTTHMGGRAAV
jgi:hypothetical protein